MKIRGGNLSERYDFIRNFKDTYTSKCQSRYILYLDGFVCRYEIIWIYGKDTSYFLLMHDFIVSFSLEGVFLKGTNVTPMFVLILFEP